MSKSYKIIRSLTKTALIISLLSTTACSTMERFGVGYKMVKYPTHRRVPKDNVKIDQQQVIASTEYASKKAAPAFQDIYDDYEINSPVQKKGNVKDYIEKYNLQERRRPEVNVEMLPPEQKNNKDPLPWKDDKIIALTPILEKDKQAVVDSKLEPAKSNKNITYDYSNPLGKKDVVAIPKVATPEEKLIEIKSQHHHKKKINKNNKIKLEKELEKEFKNKTKPEDKYKAIAPENVKTPELKPSDSINKDIKPNTDNPKPADTVKPAAPVVDEPKKPSIETTEPDKKSENDKGFLDLSNEKPKLVPEISKPSTDITQPLEPEEGLQPLDDQPSVKNPDSKDKSANDKKAIEEIPNILSNDPVKDNSKSDTVTDYLKNIAPKSEQNDKQPPKPAEPPLVPPSPMPAPPSSSLIDTHTKLVNFVEYIKILKLRIKEKFDIILDKIN